MNKKARTLLILIAVVCFGVALYYPISELVQKKQNENSMADLAALRDAGLRQAATMTKAPATEAPEAAAEEEPSLSDPEPEQVVTAANAPAADVPNAGQADEKTDRAEAANAPATQTQPQTAAVSGTQAAVTDAPGQSAVQPVGEIASAGGAASATEAPGAVNAASAPENPVAAVPPTTVQPEGQEAAPMETAPSGQEGELAVTPTPGITAQPTPTPEPTPTPNRMVNTGTKTWDELEKISLDESRILPQYRQLYEMNTDLVGWMTINRTNIDFPVMQHEDEEYYLDHDFAHKKNENGLLILGTNCDAYTPSYNLVVSGHNRNNGTMFSNLRNYYGDYRHWKDYKYIQFDSLMEERTYIVFGAFYSGVYADDEEGFRYNADIKYSIDATQWLQQVDRYKLYDTGVDVKFGDQFLTLTTCNSSRRKNGRFVVVARLLREDETME